MQDNHSTTTTVESTGAHGGAREFALLQFDPGVGIWALITFGLLLLLLRKFAWKPILTSIDERDRKMKESLESAEQLRLAGERQTEEQRRILSQSRDEAAQILGDARKSAEELKNQIVEAARSEKEKILQGATHEIENLTLQAKSELRGFTADLAVGAAEKIMRQKLDEQSSKKLTDQYIEELKA